MITRFQVWGSFSKSHGMRALMERERNGFPMVHGAISLMMLPGCFEERDADQEVGLGRLPGRVMLDRVFR